MVEEKPISDMQQLLCIREQAPQKFFLYKIEKNGKKEIVAICSNCGFIHLDI